jgi:carboxymethylenebutenolidase
MTIRTIDVDVAGLHGYLAQPPQPAAAVLVLPTVAGLDAFSRARANALAAAGLTALVWHPYSGQAPIANMQDALARAQTLTDTQALDEMIRWLDYLQAEHSASTAGVIGFCMGGRYALLLSERERRIASCAAIYPSISQPRQPNQEFDAVAYAARIHCPVVTVYPGQDHVMSAATFQKLQANLQSHGQPSTIQYYPNARHGFLHHTGEANEAASRLAWPQITAFLQCTLDPAATAAGISSGV